MRSRSSLYILCFNLFLIHAMYDRVYIMWSNALVGLVIQHKTRNQLTTMDDYCYNHFTVEIHNYLPPPFQNFDSDNLTAVSYIDDLQGKGIKKV